MWRVDLARQLDEARVLTVLARLPRQIKRVDRDAVPAQSWAGVERHETERLGLGRFDDFPDVDAHRGINHLQLVHQRDVDAPENVFQQLGGLGCAT